MAGTAPNTSRNVAIIRAERAAVYRAFTDPDALIAWQAPDDMTALIHHWDHRPGGGYEMSLFYAGSSGDGYAKSGEGEDRYTARFVELDPPRRIVEAIRFNSDDPAFAGQMTMTVTLESVGEGTRVIIVYTDIPPGINPADNEAGTASSLEKLARYVEGMA